MADKAKKRMERQLQMFKQRVINISDNETDQEVDESNKITNKGFYKNVSHNKYLSCIWC